MDGIRSSSATSFPEYRHSNTCGIQRRTGSIFETSTQTQKFQRPHACVNADCERPVGSKHESMKSGADCAEQRPTHVVRVRGTHSCKARRHQVLTLLKVDADIRQGLVGEGPLSLCNSSVLGRRRRRRGHCCFAQCAAKVSGMHTRVREARSRWGREGKKRVGERPRTCEQGPASG